MRIWRYLFFLGAFAVAAAGNAAEECPSLKTVDDVIQCSLKIHPEIRKVVAEHAQSKALINAARPHLNPELSVEALPGGSEGPTAEVVLAQPIELGNKREKRVELAQANADVTAARIEVVREQVASEVYLALVRLRQIRTELQLLDEAVETGQIVERQYGRVLRLNPEQEISLSVLRLSEEQHRLQKNDLLAEQKKLQSSIELAIGRSFSIDEKLLPKEPTSWPKAPTGEINSAGLIEAQNQVKTAFAEKSLAQAQSWPDLTLGPKLEFQGGERSESRIGVVVALPLPIFNRNQAQVAVAESGAQRAEIQARAVQTSVEKERENQLETYERIASSLKATRSRTDLEIRHERMHSHLSRGVISPTLVIELHRQIFEYRRSLHEHQMQALSSLIRLRQIHGSRSLENLL